MFQLFVVTLEQEIFDGEVESLIVPGKVGYFEVLTNHAAIISSLRHGEVTFIDSDKKKHHYYISSGFLEVSHNVATLLADSLEQKGP